MTYLKSYRLIYKVLLAVLLAGGSVTAMAQSTGVRVRGNVYGGGNLADVKGNTEVNICAEYDATNHQSVALSEGQGITVGGSVFGGGKGKADEFTCAKAMVGVNNAGDTIPNYANGTTTVRIGNGTIGTIENGKLKAGTGDVYGGGEIGRVEMHTTVEIGCETGSSSPTIMGNVFGAGAGVETHGYSALVRGNSTVTVQGQAEVWQNVYGGGKRASVGRYYVAQTAADTTKYHVRIGMPCYLKAGGKCTVNIQDGVNIGTVGIANSGDVFGAGQGVVPAYNDTIGSPNRSKRMVFKTADHTVANQDYWDYYEDENNVQDTRYVWEYFATETDYLQFVETLGRSSETDVVIGGKRVDVNTITTSSAAPTVKGTVYGGSESGFVYKNAVVNIQKGEIDGDVFGGGKGLLTYAEAGRVRRNTSLTVSNGEIHGNVYGGGSLGDVGHITKPADYNYIWTQTNDSTANVPENNKVTYASNDTINTGVCTVLISGGTIGTGTISPDHGNVFGAGRGSDTTWWCEKAMVFATNVTVSAGTVNGNVYGGGQIGRVEDDAKVVIGEENATGSAAPTISGSVFGAGAGVKTHGYSALVRGNSDVTVQGAAQVGVSVYGGGETASVGKFTVIGGLPKHPDSGGKCNVTIQDQAHIGTGGTGHHVFGACKGVTPAYNNTVGDANRSKSMQLWKNRPADHNLWSSYDNDTLFIWRYYASAEDYEAFLKTLALTSHPTVNISEQASVHGSVYGGGERGLTLGNVVVNITGGTVYQDVYGGGALADSNAGNWDADGFTEVTGLAEGASVKGLYTKTVVGGIDTYTEITNDETYVSGTYYSKGKWDDDTKKTAKYTTAVNLTGGLVKGDAYGGGLGQKTGFNSASSNIEATVWGDISVNLGDTLSGSSATAFEITKYSEQGYTDVIKSGRVFGCNNLMGSPQGNVTVTVWKTVSLDEQGAVKSKPANKDNTTYELAAVYGGGNLAPYETPGMKAHVNIHGCDLTSIQTVYGGGNAAPVPETQVDVYSCFEIGALFGGGNGKDKYKNDTEWKINPGANINGNANTMIYGGTVHEAYGGSNEKGTITGSVTIDVGENVPGDTCLLDVGKLVGAGKNADVNGDLKIIMGCKPAERIPLVFGGADNANVNGNVELTITSGHFGRVFGGNNDGGSIKGYIKLNIEETTCIPLIIDSLYLCGNNAAYSQYGYYVRTTETDAGTGTGATGEHAKLTDAGKIQLVPRDSVNDIHLAVKTYSYDASGAASWTVYSGEGTDTCEYAAPVLNVTSCTRIGEVFGGGYGQRATVHGNPTVNINMTPGGHAAEIDRDGNGTADDDDTLLGEIGDVYGGGDAAAVYGNTTVNIGTTTSTSVYQFALEGGEWKLQQDTVTVNGEETYIPKTLAKTVTGAYITGNVYGGGKLADVGQTHTKTETVDGKLVTTDVIDIEGSTSVNICAVKGAEILDTLDKPTGRYNYTSVSFAAGAPGVTIGGNVYGGGKGQAIPSGDGAFRCSNAMVTKHTNVAICNGTIGDGTDGHGYVYGGGEKGRVQENTSVTIGCAADATSAPVIMGNVFGAGQGVSTHGYSALVRGNSFVTVQGNSKVKKSVYGGGEIASVGKYNVNAQGLPESLANQGSGYCTVVVRDSAVIGPDSVMLMTAAGSPDDFGHVFGAGKGVLPYEGYPDDSIAWRVYVDNSKQPYLSKNQAIAGTNESDYLTYVETLGLATQTYVTVMGNAFVKGSVYGGSENGYVQHDTQVNIQDNCQIGNGYVQMTNDGVYLDKLSPAVTPRGVNRPYTAAEWEAGYLIPDATKEPTLYALVHDKYYTSSLPECASWPYGQAAETADKYVSYDKYADADGYEPYDGRTTADDGHTYYGNVFGGGSGCVPYRPGKWHPEAGSVAGNTVVNITGGHILTNIYGGNELTDVKGKCTVNFGGTATLGVPRTLKQIAAHPVTCYLFGAGKGDPRVLFNKATNVEDVVVNITGGTIYGSVFGGGEDGHVLRDVMMTIGTQTTTGTGDQAVTTTSGPTIGTWGTSYVDGNVFGGGRGFTGDAYTAGNVAGSVKMEIKGGTILGSIYGGGRLGSVGYGLFESTDNTGRYGTMRPDDKADDANNTTTDYYTKGDVGLGRGHIDITISGGVIGNNLEYIIPDSTNMRAAGIPANSCDISKWNDTNKYWDQWKTYHNIPKTEFDTTTGRLYHTKGGNVYAGGMGNFYQQDGKTPISGVDWWKLGCVKSTKLTITGGIIKSTVYGGGELGQVVGYHIAANDTINVGTELMINGDSIGTELKESNDTTRFAYGSVYGGGYGSLMETFGSSNPKYIAGRVKAGTKVTMMGGTVMNSVYGGGKMAAVGESVTLDEELTDGHTGDTHVIISGGTIGKAPIPLIGGGLRYFGGASSGNVYGGGSGDNNTVRSGHIYGNTYVTISGGRIYHNVYGGGAYGSVGDFTYVMREDTVTHTYKVFGVTGLNPGHANSGVATVTITGGTIGYDGKNNGMVFGSSRGDINRPGERDDHTAWVYDTHVTIGTAATPASETQAAVPASGPAIKGSVYGSGENGHTFNNTVVTINGGKIGIDDSTDPGYSVTSNGTPCSGAAYSSRGNVYGGGCGTDKYYSNHNLENHDGEGDTFNALAGIVYGDATININGGTVVRNVYGAGSMGSVGRVATTTTNNVSTTTISGGTTTINVTGGTIGTSGTVGDGNIFGAARGDLNAIEADLAHAALSRVFNTNVTVSGGEVKGNVYGGGELGDVGIINKADTTNYNYTWTGMNNAPNTSGNNTVTGTNNNTGVCTVAVTGGTIGTGAAMRADGTYPNGNVFGGGKGSATTWWCEKAIAYATDVSVSKGTVKGSVYGGGEVGRVGDDAKVTIGTADETGTAGSPAITGSVYGAGAGLATHGYSALVRGNSDVTVQGITRVGGSVYGGGEIASVGRFSVVDGLPKAPQSGGTCTISVTDHANIGASGTDHHVFGACKGVTPAYNNTVGDANRSKSMQLWKNRPADSTLWSHYDNDKNSRFIWRYYKTESDYLAFLKTLALTSNTNVTVSDSVIVNGSVFGGGERGITLGGVDVNIAGGTVSKDVYGGGSLADSNTAMWSNDTLYIYHEATGLEEGASLKGYYRKEGNVYTLITDPTAVFHTGGHYYAHYTTTVNLTGGTVNGSVYGGGLGQLANDTLPAVEAKVYGGVLVKLNEPTGSGDSLAYGNCVVKNNIFGCNNLNGSPQSTVTVHVYKTTDYTGHVKDPAKRDSVYNVNAVYGGGNLAAFSPDYKPVADTVVARVIIDGCGRTSIGTVYGGGNAASVPATEVIVNATHEIGSVFGGGNGLGNVSYDGGTTELPNPGANVGYRNYSEYYQEGNVWKVRDKAAYDTKTKREASDSLVYGSGRAHAIINGGTVHKVYGGSNTKGNVRVESRATLEDGGLCDPYTVDDAYGGGNNALMDGNAVLEIGCISGLGKAYGGASNADVNGNVELTITNGTYGQVFAGNDLGGLIHGSIKVNIEETGCRPIIIGELYGGGNRARYSVYGYDAQGNVLTSGSSKVADPQVNVYSFTSIGNIFGGGYGKEATMVGDPQVNIDVYEGKYADTYNDSANIVPANYKVFGYPVPTHARKAIGAINNVYGGGNAAEVIGSPTVNIGTLTGDSLYEEVPVNVGTTVAGKYTLTPATGTAIANTAYYQKNGEVYKQVTVATGDDVKGYYTVTAATGTAVSNTTYCQKKMVKGVDIRGNVYGGGNNAPVTGDTNVVIGKKKE